MNTKLFLLASLLALLALPAGAQTIIAQDNASSKAYVSADGSYSSYSGLNGGTGFGAFSVAATGNAGTFEYTSKEAEDGSANIDTPAANSSNSPLSFGVYAQNLGSSTTITRDFNVGPTVGDTFSLDFVTGYNDGANGGGTSGVSLTNAAGTVGSFAYLSNDQYQFNGTTITGQDYKNGALHLVYDITSATTYSLAVTGPFSFSGTGTFTGPITGFQVAQTNSGSNAADHNAYFNNLSETAANPASAAPEPSEVGALLITGLAVLALAARRRIVRPSTIRPSIVRA